MSIRSIRQVLIVAFGVSLSGLAFARTPPALVAQREAAAHATKSAPGYRDMNQRFGNVAERTPATALVSRGYRDMNYRFQATIQGRDLASAPSTASYR